MQTRSEKDTMGIVEVPADKTGVHKPNVLLKISRSVNPLRCRRGDPGFCRPEKKQQLWSILTRRASGREDELIVAVCDEILAGKMDDQFPLVIWQTGSGTQSNWMSMKWLPTGHMSWMEVNWAKNHHSPEWWREQVAIVEWYIPNSYGISAYKRVVETTIPGVEKLRKTLAEKSETFKDIAKTGRTHLMDATPLTLGQEFSGYVSQLDHALIAIKNTLPHLAELALGGTAVGTGLNAPKGYDRKVAEKIAELTGLPS